jgi:WD40 repeat protein
VRLWDIRQGKLLRTMRGHKDTIRSLVFSSNGAVVISGSEDGTIKWWDANTGKLRRTLKVHDEAGPVALSPDGKLAAVAGKSEWGDDPPSLIKLWDLTGGKLKQMWTGHKEDVKSLSFSPDGKTLASGGQDSTAKLWDVQTGKLRHTLTGHNDWVFALAFAPNGVALGCGVGKGVVRQQSELRLWNARSGSPLRTLPGHDDVVKALAFSPDGTTLLSGSWDGTTKLWDARSGRLRATLLIIATRKNDQSYLTTDWIAYTTDGYYDASPGAEKFIRWRVGAQLFPAARYSKRFHRPDLVQKALGGG